MDVFWLDSSMSSHIFPVSELPCRSNYQQEHKNHKSTTKLGISKKALIEGSAAARRNFKNQVFINSFGAAGFFAY